jgi:polyphosphate kinase
VLVHHPYETFLSSVSLFVASAAADPDVLAIKQTLYRTSGPASPIALSLARAAQAGKQVVALVELKARGDEQANITWAQALEEAGVHVVYGLVGLKTHAKVILVVRQEGDGIRRYVHVATGNYNPNTARAYEDLGLLSADEELGADASELFNFLTGYSRQRSYRKLLVAPMSLRSSLLKLIRQEATEPDGRIVIKCNSLEDAEMTDALYEASQGGAHVDLIVRGMCVLRPGVPGLSERIRVRSMVGHYLEHSRIYRFGSERRGPRYYIGSADVMERNLDRRVEAVVPVQAPELQARLAEVIETQLADDTLAWELHSDASWHKVETKLGINAQERLAALATERAHQLENENLLA